MFDIGASELLVIAIVAILVIGPKDMPMALRTAGRWIGKIRRVSSHFRSGLDAMIREAELEDMEKKWKAQNEAIMARSTGEEMAGPLAPPDAIDTTDGDAEGEKPASAESRAVPPEEKHKPTAEPQLPLDPPAGKD